jgi:hypothetical protein
MAYHNGKQFTTIDVDNDLRSGLNCAADEKFGGWWFKSCANVNLNGLFSLCDIMNFEFDIK